MTDTTNIFARLASPFRSEEVKVRTQAGKKLSYITSRTCMNRLDEVVGPSNWWDDYQPLEHSVICRLTVRLPDGTVLTKCDAGGYAGMSDPGDDDKSGFSDAFKRAAVKFGVGRYLYQDGVPHFAPASQPEASVSTPAPDAPKPPAPTAEALYDYVKRHRRLPELRKLQESLGYPEFVREWNADQCRTAFDRLKNGAAVA
jgi:hypothetical protein